MRFASLCRPTAAALLLTLALPLAAPALAQDLSNPPAERRLDVAFLLHFNQDLVPLSRVGSHVVYDGLIETLRGHPEVPFQIQISGTLLNALQWFDPSPIDRLREGVADGQFELWGSTYSQNILYASGDDWTNARQIEAHRALLERYFGVAPRGFWNPERVWTQPFVSLLAGQGYTYTAVEAHIVEAAGPSAPPHVVRTTRHAGDTLAVVYDDTAFKNLFDRTINGGPVDSLLLYLRGLYEADVDDAFLVGYFQDAEATGFWQFENGTPPAEVFARLDTVLTALAAEPWLRITTAGRFLDDHAPAEDLTPIPDGQADWMITFSRAMGYEDWYDYFERDPVQTYFRPIFAQARDSLHAVRQALEAAPANAAARRLFDRAVRTFLSHEYEYGASWYWTPRDADFNLVRETHVSLLAARHALVPTEARYIADVNFDGVDEVVLADAENLYVFTPEGGRLLYWFDLARGASLVGNENFAYYTEPYANGGRYVPPLEGGKDVYPWLMDDRGFPAIFDWVFEIRRRALTDWLSVGGRLVDTLAVRAYDVTLGKSIVFDAGQSPVSLTKAATPGPDGLHVAYTLRNRTAEALPVELVVDNAFAPGYVEVMDGGPGVLAYGPPAPAFDPLRTRTVRNTETGDAVCLAFDAPPFYVTGREVVFARTLSPKYAFTLAPGAERTVGFTLRKGAACP